MKKSMYILILTVILGTLFCISFLGVNNTIKNDGVIKIIDKEIIEGEIIKSSMEDGGFRFINSEFKEAVSAYATYYINKAKIAAKVEEDLNLSYGEEEILIDKFLNTDKLNIADVYCVLELIDYEKVIINKDKILKYINSLYDKNMGCYTLTNTDNYDVNMHTTYIATKIVLKLRGEIQPINEWLKKAEKELFIENKVRKDKSSEYVKLFELMIIQNIEVSDKYLKDVLQMFERSFKTKDYLNKVYIPVYLTDYLELCELVKLDNAMYSKEIINIIWDGNAIREDVIIKNDAYGLFAILEVLNKVSFDFKNNREIESIFIDFDKFVLEKKLYISPGNVESNIVDTYYVNAIADIIGIKMNKNIIKYARKNIKNIMNFNITYNYYYLDLLKKSNNINVIRDVRKNVILETKQYLRSLVDKENLTNAEIEIINNAIKSLNILGEKYDVGKTKSDNIIEGFRKSKNEQQSIYDIITFVEFLHLTNTNRKDLITSYCKELEKELIESSLKNYTNKIILQSCSVELFRNVEYSYSDDFVEVINRTLVNAKDVNGLFKGGDSNADIITFRSNYDAMRMEQLLTSEEGEKS